MNLSNLLRKAKKFITDKDYRFLLLAEYGVYNGLSDEAYIRKKYRAKMGKELHLEHPRTFNEKLQWLKCNDRRPEYTVMVDKFKVREYIKNILGEEYLIPLLGVWDDPEQIDFDKLPNQFVLKCNHNSGLGMCICKDKSKLNIANVKKALRKGLAQDYYLTGREWPYHAVPRKIIAEKYMTDDSENPEKGLNDYKFFCFNGEVDCVMVCIERNTGTPKFYFFDGQWNLKKYNVRGRNAPEDFSLSRPHCLDEMFEIAARLSKGLPFARVDLYECDGRVYFGEITFFPDSGFDANLLKETDIYFGEKIHIFSGRDGE